MQSAQFGADHDRDVGDRDLRKRVLGDLLLLNGAVEVFREEGLLVADVCFYLDLVGQVTESAHYRSGLGVGVVDVDVRGGQS